MGRAGFEPATLGLKVRPDRLWKAARTGCGRRLGVETRCNEGELRLQQAAAKCGVQRPARTPVQDLFEKLLTEVDTWPTEQVRLRPPPYHGTFKQAVAANGNSFACFRS
jgi:hypothetical protein